MKALRFVAFFSVAAFLALCVILPHTIRFNPTAVDTLVQAAIVLGVCYLGVFVLLLFGDN